MIEGELICDTHLAVEAKVFDSQNILLAKYAPCLMKKEVPTMSKGLFTIEETIALPENMTNGEYRLQIELTHPNVKYLAVIPDAAKLLLSNYYTPTGDSLMYNQNGMLLLQ